MLRSTKGTFFLVPAIKAFKSVYEDAALANRQEPLLMLLDSNFCTRLTQLPILFSPARHVQREIVSLMLACETLWPKTLSLDIRSR